MRRQHTVDGQWLEYSVDLILTTYLDQGQYECLAFVLERKPDDGSDGSGMILLPLTLFSVVMSPSQWRLKGTPGVL